MLDVNIISARLGYFHHLGLQQHIARTMCYSQNSNIILTSSFPLRFCGFSVSVDPAASRICRISSGNDGVLSATLGDGSAAAEGPFLEPL